jgi:predicted RNA-binding protein associated with RNAse of E/G family
MKRKYIDRSKWERIKRSKCVLISTFQERFNGYASAIFIEKVHEKLVCSLDERQFCLVDNGYVWIQRLPIEKNWSVTTMFDENNNIIQWYFDITKQNSIDVHGQPFYDDLYLDVVVFPSGEIVLLDEDELKEALENGDITQIDFDLAYKEANQVMNGMAKDITFLSNMSYNDLEFFRKLLNVNID